MATASDDRPFVEHKDQIGVENGADALGDHEAGPPRIRRSSA